MALFFPWLESQVVRGRGSAAEDDDKAVPLCTVKYYMLDTVPRALIGCYSVTTTEERLSRSKGLEKWDNLTTSTCHVLVGLVVGQMAVKARTFYGYGCTRVLNAERIYSHMSLRVLYYIVAAVVLQHVIDLLFTS